MDKPADDGDQGDMGAMFLVMQASLTAAIGMIAITGANDIEDANNRLQVMRNHAEFMKDNLSKAQPIVDDADAFDETCSKYLGYIFDIIRSGLSPLRLASGRELIKFE